MTVRTAFKIVDRVGWSDLKLCLGNPNVPVIITGIKSTCPYTWKQFKTAFLKVEHYYSKKYGNHN